MRKIWSWTLMLLVALALSHIALGEPAPGDATVPTVDDLKRLLDAGKYAEALKGSARVLQVEGPAAEKIDRGELFLVKAEAHVQLRQQEPAIAAFESAERDATDLDQWRLARANAALLKRSPNFTFTAPPVASVKPGEGHSAPATTYNVVNQAERKAAFAALFDLEWSQVQPRIEAMHSATGLEPVVEAIKLVQNVAPFEFAATGDTPKCTEAMKSSSETARNQIDKWLDENEKRVQQIDKSAHAMEGTRRRLHRRGLSGDQSQELRDVIATCESLVPATDELADALGAAAGEPTSSPSAKGKKAKGKEGKDQTFKALSDRASALHKSAEKVLNGRY
jgi:hypothetical protein